MAALVIPYWGAYAGTQFDYDPSRTATGREFLDAIRQYDPSASFVEHQRGGEGGSGAFYQLSFDQSKVPFNHGQVDVNANAYDPLYNSPMDSGYSTGHGFDMSQLYDPNAIRTDPVLGRVTDASNVRPDSGTWLDYLGPAAVAAFAFGVPYLASAMSGGAIGGFSPGMYALGGSSSDLSGLGASDPYLQGGTGAMDMTGSAGTGIPGSFGANAPLGSAQSSLFGIDSLTDPANALGGAPFNLGDQPLLPMMTQEPVYTPMTPFNPADPGYGPFAINPDGTATAGAQLAQQLAGGSGLLSQAGRLINGLGKIPGLGGGSGSGGSGGGNGLLAMAPRAQQTYTDLTNILRHFYG